ncbi:MAG: helix-turn-helix transcriptional regulator [Acidobacteria bacterium]|nr:helix-turn-helix transcriptional regulator [Acidobacteriota bacterium]
METRAALDHIAGQFAALASPPRIQIVRLLLAAYQLGGLTVGQIQAELDMPGSTLNHHLGKLERAGLVESRRQGRSILCSAHAEGLREMLNFLFQECCTRSEIVSTAELAAGRKIS